MNNSLKMEQAAQLAIAVFALWLQPLHFSWWIWPILFLLPDLGMLGYLIDERVGALTYNLFHHKAIAFVFISCGYLLAAPVIYLAGLLLWAHSSFDRVMGYGLKYSDSFHHTHLGFIGHKDVEAGRK